MRSIVACLTVLLIASVTSARELTFEQRVAAQAAIERVYHAHQIGATKSFEEAVPRAVLEKKVRHYLRTPVTAEMLERELARMAEGSRMPGRLRELFEALGNDPFLIQECLVRPALVERSGTIGSDADDSPVAPTVASSSVKLPRLSAAKSDFSPTSCAANDTWDNGGLANALEARSEHTAVWTGTHMIVWGGQDDVSFVHSGHRYDPATDSWTLTSLAGAPRSRIGHSAVWTGSVMIVFGGYDTLDFGVVKYWGGAMYDPVADTWQVVSSVNAPSLRAHHTAVWTGSRMIVWGGGQTVAGTLTNTGASYDPASDTWTAIATAGAPIARYRQTAVWTGSKMIVWGGYTAAPGDTGPVQTGGAYDPLADSWAATSTTIAPSARALHVAVWTGTEMIIWGGANAGNGTPLNTGGRYNPDSNAWASTTTSAAPSGKRKGTAVWTGSRMFVFGGISAVPPGPSNTGGLYDPQADTWTATTTANAPSLRTSHTAVWTGSEAIVWGGAFSSLHQKTGGRYNPATNSWTPTAADATPRARLGATSVWTGTHVIVWGGGVVKDANSVNVAAVQTGGRYDPALDFWVPTSIDGAPSGRIYHTAVWTGQYMIVWGGASNHGGSSALATGGMYDPVRDIWNETPVGPTARRLHAAVWTGSRMVIWGGDGNSTVLNTGSRFDPDTDSWSATTTVGAPTPRSSMTGIWTGSRVLIWSGDLGENTGGLYDPVADTWTTTSTVGAPNTTEWFVTAWAANRLVAWSAVDDGFGNVQKSGGRYDPATDTWTSMDLGGPVHASKRAVSTGNRMILWGGQAGDSVYDAVANSWAPVSSAGAPTARYLHVAVWTGDSMLVWGGGDIDGISTPRSDGGLYVGLYPDDADGDGATGCDGDCDDSRSDVYPGAPELCDRIDNDCTDGVPATERDLDNDGVSTCNGDCNDANPLIWPGGIEQCNGLDDDCNATVPADEADADGDGVRICAGDCDDTRASVKPGAPQLCDGLENNCLAPAWPAASADEVDNDGDDYVECTPWTGSVSVALGGGDCDDAQASRYPRAPEVNNGQDDQCPGDPGHGVIDEMSGTSGFFSSADDTLFSWPAQAGASSYEIVRSRFADFHAACTRATSATTAYSDPVTPPAGTLVFYLVRAAAPLPGSWGQDGDLFERTPCTGCVTTGDWCDDESVCTPTDACVGTVCTGGSAVSCDDGNPCTNDSCDPVTGCNHTDNTQACNDGNACTTGDVCGGGACQPGPTPAHCDDGNVCTADSCNPATGCVAVNNTLTCDDGNECTSGDVCGGGVCAGTLPPAANHLVISQVQVEGDGAFAMEDEFVEIYNPTAAPISLNGKSIQWKTNAGGAVYTMHAFGNVSVPAHGWFLLAKPSYNGPVAADELNPDFPLANVVGNLFLVSNTTLLSGSCPVVTTSIIDKVAYGTGACPEGGGGSGTGAPQPPPNDSIIRKPGGVCGSGIDTDVNSADFMIQSPATPHNSASTPRP